MNRHKMDLQAVYVRGSDGEFHLHAKASQEKKSATHYDLLIRKAPEEMAEWIETVAECRRCPVIEEHCTGEETNSRASCMAHWLDYLKSEVKE